MAYLRNCWYVAAWPHELGEGLLSRRILGEPVLLFRKENGEPAALEDRCAHRHVRLSEGRRIGDLVECAYHGLRFEPGGRCVYIPAQDDIPSRARVSAYPIVERHGWAWIWMGDPEAADPDRVPDVHRLSDPRFAATGGSKHVKANYELVNDNLMDLSHVGYVHQSTIGTSDFGPKARLSVSKTERGVRVTRWVVDCAPPPTYCKTGVFKPEDRIDRWQIIDYEPASFIQIYVGGAPTGTGAPEGRRVGGLGMWIMNAMTPETAASTHYHWAVGRDYLANEPAVTGILGSEVSKAFDQDLRILEIQQESIDLFVDPENVDIVADSGGVQARRLLRRLMGEETRETVSA